jgi:hypothetical protein
MQAFTCCKRRFIARKKEGWQRFLHLSNVPLSNVTSAHCPLLYGLARVIESLYKGGAFLKLPSGVLDALHLLLVEGLVNNALYEVEIFRPSRVGQG